jgi:hypothetical protein
MGFRAPAVAPELFGAASAIGAWALLGAGALGVHGPVGLGLHRRGLLVLAVGLVVLPLVTGRVTHAELDVPCALAAAVLVRIGVVRWTGIDGEPDPVARTTTPAAPVVADPPSTAGGLAAPRATRLAGRLTGRAGTVLGREAASLLPRAARAAGRAAGRALQQPPR